MQSMSTPNRVSKMDIMLPWIHLMKLTGVFKQVSNVLEGMLVVVLDAKEGAMEGNAMPVNSDSVLRKVASASRAVDNMHFCLWLSLQLALGCYWSTS